MPVLTPEQENVLREKAAKGLLSPSQMEAWKVYQQMQQGTSELSPAAPIETPTATPIEPSPASPAATSLVPSQPLKMRVTFTDPEDPRANSPWYQRMLESYARGTGLPEEGVSWTPPAVPGTKPGEMTDATREYQQTLNSTARELLTWAPGLVAGLAFPPAAAPLMTSSRWLPWAMQKALPILRRAGLVGGAQYGAEEAANIIDPSVKSDPTFAAELAAGGEVAAPVVGGLVKAGGRMIHAPWSESKPMGVAHRTVIEDVGGKTAPAMVSDRFASQVADTALLHTPFTRHRKVYEETQRLLNEELKKTQAAHPSGKVAAASDDLWRQVQAMETPGAIQNVPVQVERRVAQVIKATNDDLHAGYQTLDSKSLSYMQDWRAGKAALPNVSMREDLLIDPALVGQITAGSNLFDDTVRLIQAISTMPDQVSLGTLMDLQKTVSRYIKETERHMAEATAESIRTRTPLSPLTQSIQAKVQPALGETQNQIQKLISPYTVNLGEAMDDARRIVGAWEGPGSQRVPPPLLEQGGQAGRIGVLEPPEVATARGLLENPQFVTFTQAHQLRSDWLKISRQKGLNVGNTSAVHGERVAGLLDKAMVDTGHHLTPSLVPEWRAINAKEKTAATILNSPLMMELAEKSPDQILNSLVQNWHPRDMRTVRAVLGNDMMDRAAEMWLSKSIVEASSAAAEAGAKGAQTGATKLLGTLDALGPDVERALFPRGVSGVRNRLRQIVAMEEALTEVGKGNGADPFVLANLKRQIGDPRLLEAAQSDTIGKWFLGGTEPLNGKLIVDNINKLEKVHGFFDKAQLDGLMHFAHTLWTVQRTAGRGGMNWSPLVRDIEHGTLALGLAGAVAWGHWYVPPLYFLTTTGLSWALTQPRIVKLLTQGMTVPAGSAQATELMGQIIAQIYSQGMGRELQPAPAPEGTREIPKQMVAP